jgi:hypothetical protein
MPYLFGHFGLKKGEFMYRLAAGFLISVLVCPASAQSPSIAVSGTVSNKSGGPISGAVVTLLGQKLGDTTNVLGVFSIKNRTFALNPALILPRDERISLINNSILISLTKPAGVGVEMFDLTGKQLVKALNHQASPGDYRVNLSTHPLAAKIMYIRVCVNQRTSTFCYPSIDNGKNAVSTAFSRSPTGTSLTKTQSIIDTVKISASNYFSKDIAISSYQSVVNVTLDSMALAKFSFFVTSLKGIQTFSGSENGFGGDFSFGKTGRGAGLLGADSICQCLAEKSMPGSKVKLWRAFLSVSKGPNGQQVNAIDRVGQGPWYDRVGRLVSLQLPDLLGNRPAADAAIKNDLPNEDGVPNHRPDPNQPFIDNHQIVTGSGKDGKLYPSNSISSSSTCQDWTSSAAKGGKPRAGLSWPQAEGGNSNWLSVFDLSGCEPGIDLSDSSKSGTPGVYTIGNGGGYGGVAGFTALLFIRKFMRDSSSAMRVFPDCSQKRTKKLIFYGNSQFFKKYYG